MMIGVLILVGIILLIFSVIDWHVKAIPSVMLTAVLFAVACLYPQGLYLALLGFIIAYLLWEAGFYSGIADIKVMVIIAFMISSINYLFVFILLTVAFGFIWKVLVKWRKPRAKNIAFVPVFLFCYLALWLLGGLN